MKIQFIYVCLTQMSALVSQRILRTLFQVIILATLSTGSVSAETLSDYCLAKQEPLLSITVQGQSEHTQQLIKPQSKYQDYFQHISKLPLNKYWYKYKLLPLSVTAQGKVFHIYVNGNELWITDEHDYKPLNKAQAPQIGDPGSIGELVLLNNDWLWIKGSQDYIAKLNVSKLPPVIETPKRISDLTDEPVYRTFSNWFDGKLKTASGRAFGYYSPRLNRIFVTGYHLGSDDMESLEVVDGQVRRLSEPLQEAYIYNEMDDYQYLAKLNGDLFVGRQGEVFFYDGSHVTTLLDISDEEKEKKTVWDKFSALFTIEEHKNVLHPPFVVFTGKNRPWSHHVIPASQRIFLTGILGKQQFFAELKQTDSPLTPVFIDAEIVNSVVPDVGFYQFPDEKQLIVITKYSVLAETPKGMTTLIKVSDPSELHANLNGNQINPLSIYNGITQKFTDYQLVRVSDSAHCIARLDPNKPIVLDNP